MRIVYSLLMICLAAAGAWGAVPVDSLMARLARQVMLNPQEKVYLHLDHYRVVPGERINYRAYCVDAVTLIPSDTSRFVYVELLDGKGNVLTRVKNINDIGCAVGWLNIPPKAKDGVYFMRAYTRAGVGENGEYAFVTPVLVGLDMGGSGAPVADGPPAFVPLTARGVSFDCDGTSLSVTVSPEVRAADRLFCVTNRLMPFYSDSDGRHTTHRFQLNDLPNGLNEVFVVDSQYNIVACGAFVVGGASDADNQAKAVLDMKPRDGGYDVGLTVPGLQADEVAQLSVSVVEHSDFACRRDIGFDLSVASEIPYGTGWVFDTGTALSQFSYDPLTDSRYNLAEVLKENYSAPAHPIEVTTTLTGKVTKLLSNRPIKNAVISCISPQVGICSGTVAGDDGSFTLGGLDAVEGSKYIVQATNNGKPQVYLKVDEQQFPKAGKSLIEREQPRYQFVESDDSKVLARSIADGVLLPELKVNAFRFNTISAGAAFSQLADFTLTQQMIEEFDVTSIQDLMRRVPGIFFRENRMYLRAHTSIFDDNPAAIAVDGVVMYDDFDLSWIHMQDVARVDVFKTGSAGIWGHYVGGGVISITLKDGAQAHREVPQCNVVQVKPLGIQEPSPVEISRTGRVLYWNPDVVIGTEPSFRFGVDVPRGLRYDVVIEGVTSSGRLIHLTAPLQ